MFRRGNRNKRTPSVLTGTRRPRHQPQILTTSPEPASLDMKQMVLLPRRSLFLTVTALIAGPRLWESRRAGSPTDLDSALLRRSRSPFQLVIHMMAARPRLPLLL